MSDDLVEWLRGCLDEDERIARAVPPRFDLFDGTGIVVMPLHGGSTRSVTLPSSVAIFAVRHDPARVLREVESKRRILDAHPFQQGIVGGVCGTCHGNGRMEEHWDGEEETVEWVDTEMVWPCPTILALAAMYGYDEAAAHPEG